MPSLSTNKNETCAHDRENIILNSVVYAKMYIYKKQKEKEKEKGAGGWEKNRNLGRSRIERNESNGTKIPFDPAQGLESDGKTPGRQGRSVDDPRRLVMRPSPIKAISRLRQAQNKTLASLVGGGEIW